MSEIKKIHCNICQHETNHKFLSESIRDYLEFAGDFDEHMVCREIYEYKFWACLGCNTALIQEGYHISGMRDHDDNDFYDYTYYPERINISKREAKKFIHIDKNLKSIYNEIIQASNLNLLIISAMGIRALLEGVCAVEEINDKKAYNLTGKIKLLETESKIPTSIITGLESLKFIGDDAAHKLGKTSKKNILLAIDLIEALLTHLYEAKFDLEQKAKRVSDAKIKK